MFHIEAIWYNLKYQTVCLIITYEIGNVKKKRILKSLSTIHLILISLPNKKLI